MTHHFARQRSHCAKALRALASSSHWSAAERRWHAIQIDRYFDNLAVYRRRMSKPNQRKTRALRHCLLTSYSGALCGFLQERAKRRGKGLSPLSPKQLERLLRGANPTKRIFDYAVLKSQMKANGTKRMIVSPGQKIRTAQWLVGDVLEASDFANPYEYSRAGRGALAAIAEIIRLVEVEGIKDFVVFDIENYFTSVNAQHLTGAPLPKKVIRHSVLFNRDAILLHGKHHEAEAETARHGLPQGARVSGITASTLLGRELRQLDGAMGIVTYVDDGVIGARDPAGANALAEALKLRLENHTGGPLSFKKLQVASIGEGFAFLGYHLRSMGGGDPPKVSIRPSHQAEAKFKRKLMQKLASMTPNPNWEQGCALALDYAESWRRSLPAWQPTPVQRAEFEAKVECLVADYFSGFTSKHALKAPPFACIPG